jgi:hypothetical protein
VKSNYFREVGCFTADFRDKKVIVGRAFHVGFFFMNSLNEYWKEAPDGLDSDPKGDWLIANRLLSTHLNMWNVQEDILSGYLDVNVAAKLHESIRYILRVIQRARPFRYLDLKQESKRCDSLFGEDSVRRINHFLQERSRYALHGDDYMRLNSSEIRRIEKEQTHLDDYVSTLDFYYNLGEDMKSALDFGEGFLKQIPTLEKRDESHLIVLAMHCLKQVPFSQWSKPFQRNTFPALEYMALPKKQKSNNYVVGKRMTFTRFLDFLAADFFEGLSAGHYPQLCENCGRYYLKTNARFQKYCTLIDPNDSSKRTCQAVAAAKGRAAKERHPLKYPFDNRMKTIRTHVRRGKITEEQAKAASRVARDRLDMAMEDTVYANTKYIMEIGQDSIYKAAGIIF